MEQQMKLSEMTPEQQERVRKYNREAKKRERDRDRQEKEKSAIPNARDYTMPEVQQNALRKHAQDVAKTITADLGLQKLPRQDGYIVDGVACVLFGLETGITQKVYEPFGMLVGGYYFPDAIASETIEHIYRFPHLLQSATFADLYDRFLQAVVRWSKKADDYATPEFVQDVKAELAGTYVLPRLPEIPKPEPEPVHELKPEKLVGPSGTPSPEEQAEFHAQQLVGYSVRELDDAARQFLIHGRRAGLQ